MQRIPYNEGDSIGRCFYISEEPVQLAGINKEAKRMAKFKCSCGNIFIGDINSVKRNKTSCGCVHEIYLHSPRKHGFAFRGKKSAEYKIWMGVKARCCFVSATGYENYGGRGITICDRWKDSFANFLEDMGLRPSPKHTIDRRNNNGNYEPDNCEWVTRSVQNNNKRNVAKYFYNGDYLTLKQISLLSELPYSVIQIRLVRHKWNVERALIEPYIKGKHLPR